MGCYVYWDKLLKISNDLDEFNSYDIKNLPLEKILPLLEEIEEIAHDKRIQFDSAKHILNDEKMGSILELVRKFYVDMTIKLEIEKANEIIQSDNPWKTLESFYFFHRYHKLIQNEHELVNFTPDKRVVFIGGGPLPITLIMLNRLYGVQCISIEIIPEIAALSKELIEKLGLSRYIKVVVGDETKLSHLDYDVVMIAAFAEPKKKVFDNIRKRVKQSVPLIYRTYSGMRAILYTPVTEEVLEGFKKVGMVLPTGNVNNTSVLIQKEMVG